MTPQELRERLLTFALSVYKFARPLFRNAETRDIARQLVRASTGAAANYRAASNGRSSREWQAKVGVALEEADESLFWLTFIRRAQILNEDSTAIGELQNEAEQLTRIFGAICRTARIRRRARKELRQGTQ